MADLTETKRNDLSKKTFGLPSERKYPMPDKSHARNAKARASEELRKGNLTAAQKSEIDRKANKVLSGDAIRMKQARGEYVSGRDLKRLR